MNIFVYMHIYIFNQWRRPLPKVNIMKLMNISFLIYNQYVELIRLIT